MWPWTQENASSWRSDLEFPRDTQVRATEKIEMDVNVWMVCRFPQHETNCPTIREAERDPFSFEENKSQKKPKIGGEKK